MYKILVLDFDLTITDIHTSGNINENLLYWYTIKNLHQLTDTLLKFKTNDWKIYIVSRGIESDIIKYLKKINISQIFDDVYGAKNISQLSESTLNWSKYKTKYLDIIIYKNKIEKTNLYFIDDTIENVNMAKTNGYSNSILLPKDIGLSSLTLVSILEKIILQNK